MKFLLLNKGWQCNLYCVWLAFTDWEIGNSITRFELYQVITNNLPKVMCITTKRPVHVADMWNTKRKLSVDKSEIDSYNIRTLNKELQIYLGMWWNGRRGGLRSHWRNPWRFESFHPYQIWNEWRHQWEIVLFKYTIIRGHPWIAWNYCWTDRLGIAAKKISPFQCGAIADEVLAAAWKAADVGSSPTCPTNVLGQYLKRYWLTCIFSTFLTEYGVSWKALKEGVDSLISLTVNLMRLTGHFLSITKLTRCSEEASREAHNLESRVRLPLAQPNMDHSSNG